ncbi:MAG: cytochrome c oxidase assembly protein [Actinobacteria bacterium]|nr:cytochrome c oxidase assembly protein [Actinomycetota bacterium]
MHPFASAATTGISWHAHPDVWVLMGGLVLVYVWLISRVGPKVVPAGETIVTSRQKMLFFSGIAIMWFGADWPMHDLSENYLFSFHMLQHMLFTLVAPGLLLAGMPRWMLRIILKPPVLFKIAKWVTRPLIALILFNVLVAVTHWPTIVNASVGSEPLHFSLHLILVTSALIMWFPVVAPLPELPRLSDPGKMLYLFGQSILPTVPASFLTFADSPIYSSYEAFPRLWGISVVSDQMTAGLIMKIGGGLLLWSIITVIFFKWHAKEEASETESLTWDDFERELQVWDLRRT